MDGKKLEYKGEEALKELQNLTANAAQVQEDILTKILNQNKGTEYLRKYLASDQGSEFDLAEFKRCAPVINYKDISPYIKRITHGETSNLLTSQPISEMLCSSGTSAGEPKLVPSTEEDLDRRTFIYNLIMPIMNQYISGLDEGKAMYLYFVKAETSTQGGLPARTVLTSYYKSQHFKNRSHDPYTDITSPDQAILCPNSNQSMYCQLLAGLIHRHQVLRIGAVFASAFLRAVSFLERNWRKFCEDIRTGKLNDMITDTDCQAAMSIMLYTPQPLLADEIEKICGRSRSWRGILCRLWPKAKYIEAVVTGSMSQYIPTLEYYMDGKLPLVCTMYASSECYFGVNLEPLSNPADVSFTLLPNMAYFEFIPIGLYRYRIGDVLQVTGFHNQAPQFRFICRRNVVLSIDNDKTNEEDLHNSITKAKRLLEPSNTLLMEYTSYADTSTEPGHYVIFWEIVNSNGTGNKVVPVDPVVLEECCAAVEEKLDYTYRRCRTLDKSIGPLEIRIVEVGTFEQLMDLFINQGASINQYKTPRCINSNSALKLLNSNVRASHFSPRDPHWDAEQYISRKPPNYSQQ